MKQLYFFCSFFEDLESDYYGSGFTNYDIEGEDSDYFYFNRDYRLCKKTHKQQSKSFFSKTYTDTHFSKIFYPTKELWEKAKSDYFAKLLSNNEADRKKILKSMEG